MTTSGRHQKAQACGLTEMIGKKIRSTNPGCFRSGNTAEVVGWGFNSTDDRPMLYIRFDNGECDILDQKSLRKLYKIVE